MTHHTSYISIQVNCYGEAVRLRRLNKRKSNYLKSLADLKDKCLRLNFNQKITEIMLEIAKHREERFEPKSQHHNKNRIVWAMQFTKLLQLSNQEKKPKPEAAIV